jgi:hypothetical protein
LTTTLLEMAMLTLVAVVVVVKLVLQAQVAPVLLFSQFQQALELASLAE